MTMHTQQQLNAAAQTAMDEFMASGRTVMAQHEATRRRDLDMNGKDPAADEAYFRSALSAWNACRHKPLHADAMIFVTIGGYDDDPRDLWEIPEVIAFMGRFVHDSGILRDQCLSPTTRRC
jgi:hypothetical protein